MDRFIVEFTSPDAASREKLWMQHIPSAAPKQKQLDFKGLATRFDFSGGHIKSACIKAAARASLRTVSEDILRIFTPFKGFRENYYYE